jgi:TLD
LLLVQAYDKETQTNHTFGALASQPWIKQSDPVFYGDGDSYLFQLEPKFQVFRAMTGQSNSKQQHQHQHFPLPNYQYFYLDKNKQFAPSTILASPLHNKHKKQRSGIGLGGSKHRPRFFIASSLDHCHLGSSDATFETVDDDPSNNNVPRNQSWDLQSLEIWGLGGDGALTSLERHRSKQDAQLQKARQVDKSAFLTDLRSGLIESKMFGFHEEIRGRDGG